MRGKNVIGIWFILTILNPKINHLYLTYEASVNTIWFLKLP